MELPPRPAALCSTPGSVPPSFPGRSFPQQTPTSHLWGQTRICCTPRTDQVPRQRMKPPQTLSGVRRGSYISPADLHWLEFPEDFFQLPRYLLRSWLFISSVPPIPPSQAPHVCLSHCFSMSTRDFFGSEPWLLLCSEVSLLGNRTQKYEFSKEIIK